MKAKNNVYINQIIVNSDVLNTKPNEFNRESINRCLGEVFLDISYDVQRSEICNGRDVHMRYTNKKKTPKITFCIK